MRTGIVLLNFGEPEQATLEDVEAFLQRIFAANALLEPGISAAQRRARSQELARQRAPGLLEEYEAIGGSPLQRQAAAQSAALERELRDRGYDAVSTYLGMQFTEPAIASAVAQAREDGVTRLIGLPVFPLCGPTTTLAALASLNEEVVRQGWGVEVQVVTGWHSHPAYTALWADAVRDCLAGASLSLSDRKTVLVFSAHGAPLRYIRDGSRYDLYVRDHCRRLAEALCVDRYQLGYQNHAGRNIEWTQPEIGAVIDGLVGELAVVVPVSFMHELSETLGELDIDLRRRAEQRGLAFHRVPVPHDDPRFIQLLAELVMMLVPGAGEKGSLLGKCLCRPGPGVLCLNSELAG